LGLETRIGTMVEDDKAVTREIRPPEIRTEPGVTHVTVSDTVTLVDSVHVELIPSPDRLRAIYNRYGQVVSSDRAALVPLVELYNLAWHEQFERSRFLTLVSVIEALLPAAETIPETVELVNGSESAISSKWAQLRHTAAFEGERAERRFAQLRSRLGELKKESTSDRTRRLVTSLEVPFETPSKVAEDIYELRSKLLHDYLHADVQGISQRIEEAFTIAGAGLKRALGTEEPK